MFSTKTVVSINQQAPPGCGRRCLGNCCIPGAKLPLYIFGLKKVHPHSSSVDSTKSQQETAGTRDAHDGARDAFAGEEESRPENYFLDEVLLAQWEDRMVRGLFRYDVTACKTKMLPGDCGFIAQLNEGRRLQKRPTELRGDQVLQPFDPHKFNFTKVAQGEVLFQFGPGSEAGVSEYHEQAPIPAGTNVVAINVSPIEYGHVLLVPRVLDQLPQRMDQESLLLALHMAVEANDAAFRLGYNSLGAFATINHLHFQAYYLAAPFPIERAPTLRVPCGRKRGGVKLHELSQFPVRGLVFEICSSSLDELSRAVAEACIYLQNENIPFNVLVADRGARVFVLPQCYAERQARGDVDAEVLDTQVNPAVWEISGHIVLKRRRDYELATEDYAWKLLAEVSLPLDRFERVKAACVAAAFDSSILLDTTANGSNNIKRELSMENEALRRLKPMDAWPGLSVEG